VVERRTEEEHREAMRALKQEQDAKVRERQERRGIVVINDGDGKGKSTAAFGMALRAAGHGQRVGLVQFIKGTWKTGEQAALARFPEIDHVISGDGFTWNTQDRARDVASAQRGFEIARRMVEDSRGDEPKYDLVILDEINIALRYEYLDVDAVVQLVKNKPRELSVVLTGRDAKPELIAIADTVTRMEAVKHAFDAGVKAREGVDF
jgi:cob(I)alamin adenosyltransferase